jgi:hypothetical protein
VPADPAGDVAVIDVAELTITPVAALPPNATVVAPDTNPVPVIATVVPPANGPALGLTALTVGVASNTNLSALPVADVPPAVVTVISTVPADSAGDVAVTDVAELTVTLTAACPAPKLTDVPPDTKFVPEIVTDVPPPVGPAPTLTPVTVGNGSYAN